MRNLERESIYLHTETLRPTSSCLLIILNGILAISHGQVDANDNWYTEYSIHVLRPGVVDELSERKYACA